MEGYELSVVRGLTKKASTLAFEWTEEGFENNAKKCVEHLKNIGYSKFGYSNSKTETGGLVECEFMNWEDLGIHKLINGKQEEWGMIYAI